MTGGVATTGGIVRPLRVHRVGTCGQSWQQASASAFASRAALGCSQTCPTPSQSGREHVRFPCGDVVRHIGSSSVGGGRCHPFFRNQCALTGRRIPSLKGCVPVDRTTKRCRPSEPRRCPTDRPRGGHGPRADRGQGTAPSCRRCADTGARSRVQGARRRPDSLHVTFAPEPSRRSGSTLKVRASAREPGGPSGGDRP